jgi:hypothetical protein
MLCPEFIDLYNLSNKPYKSYTKVEMKKLYNKSIKLFNSHYKLCNIIFTNDDNIISNFRKYAENNAKKNKLKKEFKRKYKIYKKIKNYNTIYRYSIVMKELINNCSYKYIEWKFKRDMFEYSYKKINKELQFLDIDEYNKFETLFESLDCYAGGPFDLGKKEDKYDGTITWFPDFEVFHYKHRINKKLKINKDFNIETKYDFCKITTNRIYKSSIDYYLLKNNMYYIFNYEYKWFNLNEENEKPHHSLFYDYNCEIKKIYYEEKNKKLYRLLCIEKINILNETMEKRLNIDCWEIICDFVC